MGSWAFSAAPTLLLLGPSEPTPLLPLLSTRLLLARVPCPCRAGSCHSATGVFLCVLAPSPHWRPTLGAQGRLARCWARHRPQRMHSGSAEFGPGAGAGAGAGVLEERSMRPGMGLGVVSGRFSVSPVPVRPPAASWATSSPTLLVGWLGCFTHGDIVVCTFHWTGMGSDFVFSEKPCVGLGMLLWRGRLSKGVFSPHSNTCGSGWRWWSSPTKGARGATET